ncbi:fimbrial protein [Ralstonia sp. A12]|uniref:fimbrial protein n=1 Tax=Ralstonia sp. A12 TaxID=1217052 RepID=UPI000A0526D4|nr:fimbrial protein [Ralstonia sp. A12]
MFSFRYFLALKQRHLGLCFVWLLSLGAWIFSSSVYAQTCSIPVQSGPQTVNFGTITVPASLAVGGIIAEQVSSPGWTTNPFCTAGTINYRYELTRFTAATSIPNVYATNIPGVGLSVQLLDNGFDGGLFFPMQGSTSRGPGQGFQYTNRTFRARLVKTGAITPGTIAAGQVARSVTNNVVNISLNFAAAFTVQNPTCSVNTASITIPLGNVAASSFANVGSVSTTRGPQNIGLTCAASPRVRMSLQGTRAAGGPTTTVALTGAGGAGVAQGIGVQVLFGGAPLVVNSTTLTTVSNAAGAALNVPISARYYRTGTVTAGRANASATLRFDYN